jgi:DNA-binding NtrC family response regulator
MNENKLYFLLVDDDRKFLDTMSDRIRLKGFEPLLATSGKEALEIAREYKIHAAVVDLKMPDMDGLATIEKLKEIHPDVKTVLLTGFGDEKVKEAAEALDSDYFEKDEMGGFWNFVKRLRKNLEDSMAAAGMATGGDLEDASEFGKKKKKAKP